MYIFNFRMFTVQVASARFRRNYICSIYEIDANIGSTKRDRANRVLPISLDTYIRFVFTTQVSHNVTRF